MRIRRFLVSGLLVGFALGVGAPAVTSAAAAATTTESCDYVLQRYQLTYANYLKYSALAADLRRQAATATGAARQDLLDRAAAHQKVADDNKRWATARAEQLRTQCGIYVQLPNIRMAYSH